MKSLFVLAIFALFSILFFACEDEAIPVPMPPPVLTVTNDSAANVPAPAVTDTTKSNSISAKPAETNTIKPANENLQLSDIATDNIIEDKSEDMKQLSYGTYTIQIAVLPSEAAAKKLVKKMEAHGIKAYYARVNNPAMLLGQYHRVRIGYFNKKSVAEKFAKTRLIPLGYAWWIDSNKNDNIGNPNTKKQYETAPIVAAPPATPAVATPATKVATTQKTKEEIELEKAQAEYEKMLEEAKKEEARAEYERMVEEAKKAQSKPVAPKVTAPPIAPPPRVPVKNSAVKAKSLN